MNRFYLTIFFLLAALWSFASHIVGGEMIYEYLGPSSTANSKSYRITLRLFRDQNCTGCAAMPGNVYIGIFNNDNNAQFPSDNNPYDIRKNDEQQVGVNSLPPCITNAPNLNYHVATYILTVDLPDNKSGYTAAYQTCCRVNPLANVYNTSGAGGTGATYSCVIPGNSQLGTGFNNSPQFAMGVSVICRNKQFTLDFSATDADKDSLVYSFCEAYDGGVAQGSAPINPARPPFNSAPYINSFSAGQPLGPKATINSKTGIISGYAPGLGKYVVCVCIAEYRNGKLIGSHRKDFIVNVNDCDFAGAELQPSYITCDDFQYTFQNLNSSALNKTYFWDFGVPGSTTDTSSSAIPTFTFPDTGSYAIKLVINRKESCSDSATSVIKVYPGFKPGFTTKGICFAKPTLFIDTTKTKYGVVNYWNWSFGDPASTANTSLLQNPTHTYLQMGTKNVQFIVGNTKGCMDTIYQPVEIIDKPPLTVAFNDTLICAGDKVQLAAIGDGNFSWTPGTTITDGTTATPTVYPTITTPYIVELDDNGCKNKDTVQVRVVDHVTLKAFSDTTICANDAVQLGAVTDGFTYEWTPTATINNPNLLKPVANPSVTTTFQVTSHIGHCSTTDQMTVKVVPYPIAIAGADTLICYGTPAQLKASIVGSSFTWFPLTALTNSNTLTPIATPKITTSYILYAMDTLGCPKPGTDTITVTVLPKIPAFAGNDTAVVINQPLQLQASGGVSYVWTPATDLNKTDVANPVGMYDGSFDNIQYKVYIANEAGCIDSAMVNVRIFKTDPRIFVPTAFTPNGDGRNDLFRPIAAGISRIDYFRVFNRWGQLVFSTTTNEQGWDGKINGKEQPSGVYVWLVKGMDFTGKEFTAKGTVTLIR